MKYRYITTGLASPDDRLSDFSLISGREMGGFSDFIRIEVPDDIKLEKWSCDPYSTTDSDTLLKDLNPKVAVRFNGKIKTDEELTDLWLKGKIEPHQFYENLESRGFTGYIRYGYLDEKQMDFTWQISLAGNHKKIWQLDTIPEEENFKGFIPQSEYKECYAKYFDALKKAVKLNKKIVSLAKKLNFSYEDLFDVYGYYCFSTLCDTRLSTEVSQRFIRELETKLERAKLFKARHGELDGVPIMEL